MAKLDAYKLVSQGGGNSASSPVAVSAIKSNIKAFAGIQYSLKGIQSTLTSMERIEIDLIENDKLREIADRRRAKREKDRLAEEAAENKNLGSPSKVKGGKLSKKDENKIGGLFGGLLGTLQKLGQAALNFLLQIGGFIAIKSTLEWVADPANQQKLVTFFEKTSFVFKKIYGFTKYLVQDRILDGISKTFGKDSSFTDRVGGLWQIITGIAGMSLLLNPFGTIDAILSLLGLDFYREAADVIDDGPDRGRQRGSSTGTGGRGNAPRTDARGNQIARQGQQYRQQLGRQGVPSTTQPIRPSRFAATMARLEVGNRFQKTLFRGGKALTAAFGKVTATAIKSAVRNFAGRIPWVGGLIAAGFSLLDGDPIDKTLFRTAGTLLSGAIGSFIPFIGQMGIGTILGSIVGDYMGELAYMLFNPRNPSGGFEQVKRKIFEDAQKAFTNSKEAVKLIWGWLGPRISAAGDFIKERAKRFQDSLPVLKIPEIQLPGFLGGGKFGGDEIVNPLFFSPLGAVAYVRALRQAFFENGPVTPVKMGIPDFFQKLQNIFNMLSSQSGQQVGGRSAQKARERERNASRAAQRQDQAAQAAALSAARDAFLERNQIRQYDPNKGYSEMELVYKNAGGPAFLGLSYKDYHVFRNGRLIHVRYYGNLHEKNFKRKEAWNAFQAGGGNAMLRGSANYDVKKVLELGFAATAQLKKIERQPQSTNSPSVAPDPKTSTTPNAGISGDKATLWKKFYQMAKNAGAKHPELVAAQFALESAWGSAVSGKNNFFGVKATPGEQATLLPTKEFKNGQYVTEMARFKDFASPQDAVNHLVRQWYKDYRGYQGVNRAKTAAEAAVLLKQESYATDPAYPGKLQRLLGEYSSVTAELRGGAPVRLPNSTQTPPASASRVQPQSSYTVGFKDYEGPGAPAKPGGSESTTPKSPVSAATPDTGFAILPYNSSESDTALPYEQATSIAQGLLGKKYSAYDLGSIGGLGEGGLQEAIDAYKGGNSGLGSLATLGDAIGLSDRLGTGADASSSAYPRPGESGYAGPKSSINELNYDRDAKLTDNTGREYGFGDVFQEIFGSPQQILGGAVNPNTFGGVRGFDLRDIFSSNKGSNPYGPLGKLSAGGPVPNNLPKYFFGKIFKGIGKAVSGVFNGVKKVVSSVVSGVGGFLSSPIGSVLTTAVGLIPGMQWVPAVAAGFRGANALMQGDIMGAITNTVGALSGFFPKTMDNFFGGITNTFGKGLGGVVNGFLQGGVGGALQGLGGMLPQGIQKFFGQVGNFIQANPSVGAVICSLPGVANVPGLANLFGLGEFPGMPGPIGIARTVAGQMGMGGIFDAMAGMMGADPATAFGQMAGELGVSPAALGITGSMSGGFGQGSPSEEYAMQTQMEFIPIPMILLKLVPIDRPVPINNIQYIPQRAPAPQQPARK